MYEYMYLHIISVISDPCQSGGPRVMSPEARELRLGMSLLTRLFRSYQEQARAAPDVPGFEAELATHELHVNGSYDTPFVSALVDNHRSHPKIVAFVSANCFSPIDALRRPRLVRPMARMPDEMVMERQPPLTFYATPSGAEEERDESDGTSWWNPAEVEEVASRVEFVLEHWSIGPQERGVAIGPDDICVVTCHAAQVTRLRERIHRDERFKNVRVEHVLDAQGAIFFAPSFYAVWPRLLVIV